MAGSSTSLNLMNLPTKQKFAKVGVFNNALVAVKEMKVRRINLDRDALKEMQEVSGSGAGISGGGSCVC